MRWVIQVYVAAVLFQCNPKLPSKQDFIIKAVKILYKCFKDCQPYDKERLKNLFLLTWFKVQFPWPEDIVEDEDLLDVFDSF